MTQESQPRAGPSAEGELAGTAQLRAEIERTRRDLGDTVEALAAKTDVKARARESADRMKADMSARGRRMAQGAKGAPKGPLIAVGATGLAAAALIIGLRAKGLRAQDLRAKGLRARDLRAKGPRVKALRAKGPRTQGKLPGGWPGRG